ncbi:MAG: FtsX-like permease family protein [Planctomycetia bacterium]|nr:FtsX-like permease family protein [Planctomycetia bacterium]
MYKLLLCWRYLRTRYIALASIISVTLGVATMIVVNAVMSGFANEMQTRTHGILADILFESHGLEGFSDYEWHASRIRELVGDQVAGMSATVHVPAMLNFQVGGRWIHRQVNIIGIDPDTYNSVSDCSDFLQHPENRKRLSFELRDGGYDLVDHLGGDHRVPRIGLDRAGWPHRREMAEREKSFQNFQQLRPIVPAAGQVPGAVAPPAPAGIDPARQAAAPAAAEPGRRDVWAGLKIPNRAAENDRGVAGGGEAEQIFDRAKDQSPGIVLGYALASFRGRDGADYFLAMPGDDVKLTFPTAGSPPKAVSATFTVVDLYESKMSEYDSAFVFVPLKVLQEMRGMIDPQTRATCVTAIQIRLKPDANLDVVRDKLRAAFPPELYAISSWRDKQGPILAAVSMETAILNILLFLIVAVAGFGILAIFFMIVVEKTRDIGVLKALGASSGGIMSIFLAYGVLLGTVGCGAGLAAGLAIVHYIDPIRHFLERLTGQELFDPSIYYFQQIPTIIEPVTIAWIICGALLIAVIASVLPAMRAARLHPVEALRYE